MPHLTPPAIADRIAAHLTRFEADEKINRVRRMTPPYYRASAWFVGRYVSVRYVNLQSETYLTRKEALRYLAWLDAGNVGKHWEVR